jgi:hypothetical protein
MARPLRTNVVIGPSDSALIAVEKSGRRARLIEFDPLICDRIAPPEYTSSYPLFEPVESASAIPAAVARSIPIEHPRQPDPVIQPGSDGRLKLRPKIKAASQRPLLLIPLVVLVDNDFLLRLFVLFLDNGRLIPRLFVLNNRPVAVVVAMIGANRHTCSHWAHPNADMRIFRGSGHSQDEPGRSN